MELAEKKCVPCTEGAEPLGKDEAARRVIEIPGWTLAEDGRRLSRKFKFRDFAAAMRFAGRVGELAEGEGHHPEITFGWGFCRVVYWTHKIGGLHENDFIMAAKTSAASEKT
jgi:4a-hydroxytetrahydrobiopterin dehydratase